MSKILEFLKDVVNLFIQKFPQFVKGLVGKIPVKLMVKLKILVDVVNNIKTFTESDAADFLTLIIPGHADDDLKEWLRKVLPGILNGLKVITEYGGVISVNLPQDREFRGTALKDIGSHLVSSLLDTSISQGRYTYETAYRDYADAA